MFFIWALVTSPLVQPLILQTPYFTDFWIEFKPSATTTTTVFLKVKEQIHHVESQLQYFCIIEVLTV